jgi:hypothetical protein
MSTLATEQLLSPELVLVSPPEVASLARQLLPDPVPAPRLSAAPTRARTSFGAVSFFAFALANCLIPFALAALLAS